MGGPLCLKYYVAVILGASSSFAFGLGGPRAQTLVEAQMELVFR